MEEKSTAACCENCHWWINVHGCCHALGKEYEVKPCEQFEELKIKKFEDEVVKAKAAILRLGNSRRESR